jgi:hypothetical protein
MKRTSAARTTRTPTRGARLTATLGAILAVAWVAWAPGAARAQDASQREALEPRADTSAKATRAAGGTAPAADTPTGRKPAATAGPDAASQHRSAADHVDLDTTTVTGNQELPKVMYIVPWKKSDIGDLAGKPLNSLLDEVLAPVDRDVFRREVRYYEGVKAAAAPGAPAPGASAPGAPAPGAAAPGEAGRRVEK